MTSRIAERRAPWDDRDMGRLRAHLEAQSDRLYAFGDPWRNFDIYCTAFPGVSHCCLSCMTGAFMRWVEDLTERTPLTRREERALVTADMIRQAERENVRWDMEHTCAACGKTGTTTYRCRSCGTRICEDCAGATCEECGTVYCSGCHEDCIHEEYCTDCAFECDNCGEWHRRSMSFICYSGCNNTVCEDCYAGNDYCNNCGATCEECGEVHNAESLDGNGVCRGCRRERGPVYDYHYGPRHYSILKTGRKRRGGAVAQDSNTFGFEWELEFPGDNVERRVSDFLKKFGWDGRGKPVVWEHDGSLNHGAECITAPMTLDYALKSFPLEDAAKFLRDIGARAESSCGLHVHIGKDESFADESHRARFRFFVVMLERWLSDNGKKGLARRGFGSYRAFPGVLQAERWSRYYRGNDVGHGWAVSEDDATVECRLPAGTTSPEKIKATLLWMDSAVEFTRCHGTSATRCVKNPAGVWKDYIAFVSKRKTYAPLLAYIGDRASLAA